MHRPVRVHRAVHTGFFAVRRQVFWQKRHGMRLKQPRSLVRRCGVSGAPPEKSLLSLCHIICRACKRCCKKVLFPQIGSYSPMICDTNCVKMVPSINTYDREKRRTVAASRHDTLFVRVLFVFLLAIKDFTALWRQQSWRKNDVNADNQQNISSTSM